MKYPSLDIIFQDECIVAINKPNGLLVHRSYIASQEDTFALQLLRDQLKLKVYPIHRLDRKTSGVLLFALSSEIAKIVQHHLQEGQIEKQYLAIVRGFFPNTINVDYPLTNDRGKTQEAITHFKLIKKVELPIPFGKHLTSRYSFIEATPETGRQHQIRKHLNHLRHPIIGDRPHGCNKQNRLFKERWNLTTMLLHANKLAFPHPVSEEKISIDAPFPSVFEKMKGILKL